MTFTGFGDDTIEFLTQLFAHNEKPWFDANRGAYETAYLERAKDFITAIGPDLRALSPRVQAVPRVNGSIFRINRDVRFSKDKTPYKDHLDLWFWEGERKTAVSGFFFRLTRDSLILGAGAHMMSPVRLKAFRGALAQEDARARLLDSVARIEAAGLSLHGQGYKRPPRGWAATGDRADRLALHKALFTDETGPHPASLGTAGFVDHCMSVFQRAAPLHRWLIDTLS